MKLLLAIALLCPGCVLSMADGQRLSSFCCSSVMEPPDLIAYVLTDTVDRSKLPCRLCGQVTLGSIVAFRAMRSLSREVGSFSEFRSDRRLSGQNRILGGFFLNSR
jgi:hypothetical protein